MRTGRPGPLRRALGRLFERPLAQIALNLPPREGPYGGGNQFVVQLEGALRSAGFAVSHRLGGSSDAALLVESRDELASFGLAQLEERRRRNGPAVVVHRINECDQRKGTEGMDALLARVNAAASHTVFVSEWLRDYHRARWFDQARPHDVIRPGADPRIFHPAGNGSPGPGETFRVATHHWSDNPMKGFAVYSQIDEAIAGGRLPGFELLVIGRWPKDVRWRAARLHEPTRGTALGELLRSAHGYVTASLWDPGPMHVAEALQCGLPVAFHEDGGGIVEQASVAGVGFRDDVVSALLELRERHAELRRAALANAPNGDEMALAYVRLLQRLLAAREPA